MADFTTEACLHAAGAERRIHHDKIVAVRVNSFIMNLINYRGHCAVCMMVRAFKQESHLVNSRRFLPRALHSDLFVSMCVFLFFFMMNNLSRLHSFQISAP